MQMTQEVRRRGTSIVERGTGDPQKHEFSPSISFWAAFVHAPLFSDFSFFLFSLFRHLYECIQHHTTRLHRDLSLDESDGTRPPTLVPTVLPRATRAPSCLFLLHSCPAQQVLHDVTT